MTDLNAKLIPLKTETPGRQPTAAQVDVGEIAVNLTDRKIFSKRTDGTVVVLAGGSKIQDSEDFLPILDEPNTGLWDKVYKWDVQGTGSLYGWDYSDDTGNLSFNGTAYNRQGGSTNTTTYWRGGVNDDGRTSLWVTLQDPWEDITTPVEWFELTWDAINFPSAYNYNYFYGCLPIKAELRAAYLNDEPIWISFDVPGLATPRPLSDWDLLRWSISDEKFRPATPDELWERLDKNLEDLHNVNADAPNEGDGLVWDASLEEWKPARLPSIELIERQVPSYRWTLAAGASPAEGEYRVASDGLNLNQIDADGNNLVNWFGYYPADSGNYWWSTDDLNWNQSTYTSKNGDGSHLRIFSNDALPPNPSELYVALGEPNTVEQLPLNEGDLIQWDGDAWVPISINDLVVDITQFSIGDLKDVDTTTSPPLNGYVLTWNDAQQKWIPGIAAQGKNNFYELNDVALVDVQDGQMVAWDFAASAWVNVDPPASGIGEAPDFELNENTSVMGEWLVYDSQTALGDGRWYFGGSCSFSDSRLILNRIDSNGNNFDTLFTDAMNAANGAELWIQVDENPVLTFTGFEVNNNGEIGASLSGWTVKNGAAICNDLGGSGTRVRLWFVDPSSTTLPLTDGDVLVYSNGKWRPKQEELLEVDLGRYELDDLGDVDVSTVAPQVGEALLWDGIKWLPGTVEGGGGNTGGGWMGNRSDDTVTTTTLAQGGGTDDTVVFLEMGQSGQFVSITVDQPAWVRLYASATDRTNDASRQLNTDPLPGSGVLLEVLTSTENETVPITPGAVYYNNDPLPASRIYARVSNYSTAEQPITVTVTCIAQTFFDVISGGTFGSGR
jgi:hypothetical protein